MARIKSSLLRLWLQWGGDLEDAKKATTTYDGKIVNTLDTLGVLYNYSAAENACPPGTRFPTDEEWNSLERTFWIEGNNTDAYNGDKYCSTSETGYVRCAPAGTALKATTGWDGDGNGTNESGLSVLPAGRYLYNNEDEKFCNKGTGAYFWLFSTTNGYRRCIFGPNATIHRSTDSKINGLSVRCVQ